MGQKGLKKSKTVSRPETLRRDCIRPCNASALLGFFHVGCIVSGMYGLCVVETAGRTSDS